MNPQEPEYLAAQGRTAKLVSTERVLGHLRLLRPKHWVKNLFLFVPLFFAGQLFNQEGLNFVAIGQLLAGFVAFSMVASSIYILNDYRDRAIDRLHPENRKRPLAAGIVSPAAAIVQALAISGLGMWLAWGLQPKFFFILSLYFALNMAYSLGMKHVSILDIITVAIGFVLRVKAGGTLSDIYVTEWLTLMVFLLALFLAVAKRRDDVLLKAQLGLDMRRASKQYNLEFLNAGLILVAGVTLVAYILYTLSPGVMAHYDTHRLYYTSVFVIAGILRYLQMAFVENNTGSPTQVLYQDRFIQLSILGWLLSFYFLIYYPDLAIFH